MSVLVTLSAARPGWAARGAPFDASRAGASPVAAAAPALPPAVSARRRAEGKDGAEEAPSRLARLVAFVDGPGRLIVLAALLLYFAWLHALGPLPG